MFYQDMTSYGVRGRFRFEVPSSIKLVGWLEIGREFTRGTSPTTFVERLWTVIHTQNISFDLHAKRMRGVTRCQLCNETIEHKHVTGEELLLGMAELWVPYSNTDPNCWYVAPTMVGHYVETHEYAPPESFVDAVMSIDFSKRINAQVYLDILSFGGRENVPAWLKSMRWPEHERMDATG